jgi:hypothetical protein
MHQTQKAVRMGRFFCELGWLRRIMADYGKAGLGLVVG